MHIRCVCVCACVRACVRACACVPRACVVCVWQKSSNKESHGSHGNFYEGEQEQCCSVPVGLYGGLRISQWHKLCLSRAGVTLAGTTGQPRQSRSFPGYCTSRSDFMTRISEGELFLIPLKLRCSVRLYCRYGPFCDHLRSFVL